MVKICGITNVDDALASADAGAHAIGFNFYSGSPRFIQPEQAAAIAAQLPSGILRIGVFVNESPARIAEIAASVPLDVVQLHGAELPADCQAPVPVWKALAVGPDFTPAQLAAYPVDTFLLDAPAGSLHGGAGRTFDWRQARGLGRRIVLAGGLGPDNVRDAIAAVQPWGVDACSRLESAPGRKDHSRLRAFIAAALELAQ